MHHFIVISLLLVTRIPRDDSSPPIWGRILAITCLLLVVVVPILVIWGRRRLLRPESNAPFFKGVTGIRSNRQMQPGDVNLVFHVYTGFLVYTLQKRFDLVLPADQAKTVLGRMLRHNLSFGFFAQGIILAPLLSLAEYRTQSKKIARAAQQGFPVEPKA